MSPLAYLALALLLAATPALAEELDAATLKALQDTQNVLKNPALRAAQPEAKSPDAQAVQKQIEILGGGGANSEAIYGLASDVMADLVKKSAGDPDKMQQILNQALKNPEAFANSLSPQQQQQIRELAKKLPDHQNGKLP